MPKRALTLRRIAECAATGEPSVAEVAEDLEQLASPTGEDAFRRAARALFQQRPGRTALDDRDAIAEAEWLIDSHLTLELLADTLQFWHPVGELRA